VDIRKQLSELSESLRVEKKAIENNQESAEVESSRRVILHQLKTAKERKQTCADDFEKFRKLELNQNIKISVIEQQMKSVRLMQTLLEAKQEPCFERLVIGAGVSATALFNEFPSDLRYGVGADNFPLVIAMNDPGNQQQWAKDGHILMGQQAAVQVQESFTVNSEDFIPKFQQGRDVRRNPFQYAWTDNFNKAIIQTQADLNMHVLNLKALKLESQKDARDWLHKNAAHRVLVELAGKQFYLYAKAVDICTGPGAARELTSSQIAPDLAKALKAQGKLIYLQDSSCQEFKGNIVGYGASARLAATMCDILETDAHPKAKVQYWVARSGREFDVTEKTNRTFTRLFARKKAPRALGTLSKVDSLSSGELELSFAEPSDQSATALPSMAGQKIRCDRLVVSIGQNSFELTQHIKDLKPCYLDDSACGQDNFIHIGNHSADGSLVVWGAAAGMAVGLDEKESKLAIASAREHAKTLPYEANPTVGVLRIGWTIRKFAEAMRNSGLFPQKDGAGWDCDLSDLNINIATRKELMAVIQKACPAYSSEEVLEFVEKIIQKRKGPSGIQSANELVEILPVGVVYAIHGGCFRYSESPPIIPRDLGGHPLAFVSVGPSNAYFNAIRWIPTGNDSYAIVSRASIPAATVSAAQDSSVAQQVDQAIQLTA
jgi:hypothetical protein